ncbi:unnamed protein product, partial [Ixodes hexagonus]
ANSSEGECTSEVCRWNENYLFARGRNTLSPCENFSEHTCIHFRFKRSRVQTLPYPDFNSGQLILDLGYFFKRYLDMKDGSQQAVQSNFLAQAIWINDKCTHTDTDRTGYLSFTNILKAFRLRDWPYREFNGDIVTLVASTDRHLRLNALFEVILQSHTEKERGAYIVLRPPRTLFRRFLMKNVQASQRAYLEVVSKAIGIVASSVTASRAAEGISRLEKELEKATIVNDSPYIYTPRKVETTIGDLRSNKSWDWITYFNILLNAGSVLSTTVVIENPNYFHTFVRVLENTAAIANYVALKTLVLFSPVLGKDFESLLHLSHDFNVPPLNERYISCSVLLEKLYKYGFGVAAKLTLSRDFPIVFRTNIEKQIVSIFNDTKRALYKLLRSNQSWFQGNSLETARGRLRNMTVVFGTSATLVQYEHYRRTAGLTLNISDTNLVENVFTVLSYAHSIYWNTDPLETSRYDNIYTMSALKDGCEYLEPSNVLFVSQATVGFLNHISNRIGPITFPPIAVHIVRGVLEALLRTSSLYDERATPRRWWTFETKTDYEYASNRLQNNYFYNLTKMTRSASDHEQDFLDNAVLNPLYHIYGEMLKGMNATNMFYVNKNGEVLNADKLFFYNYVSGFCKNFDNVMWPVDVDSVLNPTGFRVNVPLRNFEPFAKAFNCRPGTYMNPEIKFSVWRNTAQTTPY